MERGEKRKKAGFFRRFHQKPAQKQSASEDTDSKPMATSRLLKRSDTGEAPTPKKQSAVRFEPPHETYSSEDIAFDVKYLKDRIRLLESQTVINPKRKQSVAVAGDDEQNVIDGSCSGRCCKYFVDLVSVTGIKEISRAKHPLVRCMWCFTFAVSICITLFYLVRSLQTYLDEPTATKVKIHRNDSYEYPDMLLCPDTWLDRSKALKSGATVGAIQYALGYLINYFFRSPPYRIADYDKAKSEFEAWYEARNYSSPVEMFKDIALDSETFFYKCPYCQYKNFSKALMDETLCYKIPMYWMSGKGTARSAIDILEVTVPDRSGGLLHKKKYWRFYVEPDLTIGISTVRYVQVFPGFSNTIRFTPMRFLSINKPDDPCMPVEKVPRGYSTVECAMTCAHKQRKCKSLGSMTQTSVMRNLSEICHYYPQYYWFLYNSIKPEMKLIDQIPEECFKKCPPLCERWLYEASVESHKISSYVPVPLNASDNSSKSEAVQMTRVYLLNQAPLQGGYMAFTEVSTYSFDAMLGRIGGVLSLWLGASIMSFIQIMVFFFTWCFARQLNKRQDTNNALRSFDNEMACSYTSNGDAKA